VTVIDSGGVVDALLGSGAAGEVQDLLRREPALAAPDVVIFETLAVLRRFVQRGFLDPGRAAAAVEDLGDFRVDLFPSMLLRNRAWQLRENMGVADALFIALAEQLDEPLATKDGALIRAARAHTAIETIQLGLG
jgi:predicted nucleic acid-binding protein